MKSVASAGRRRAISGGPPEIPFNPFLPPELAGISVERWFGRAVRTIRQTIQFEKRVFGAPPKTATGPVALPTPIVAADVSPLMIPAREKFEPTHVGCHGILNSAGATCRAEIR